MLFQTDGREVWQLPFLSAGTKTNPSHSLGRKRIKITQELSCVVAPSTIEAAGQRREVSVLPAASLQDGARAPWSPPAHCIGGRLCGRDSRAECGFVTLGLGHGGTWLPVRSASFSDTHSGRSCPPRGPRTAARGWVRPASPTGVSWAVRPPALTEPRHGCGLRTTSWDPDPRSGSRLPAPWTLCDALLLYTRGFGVTLRSRRQLTHLFTHRRPTDD